MKVAILGNMNNNGFAIMRYLLDQGVDVDLILFDSDYLKGSEHFGIEKDTWYKEKYKKNVKILISLLAQAHYFQILFLAF